MSREEKLERLVKELALQGDSLVMTLNSYSGHFDKEPNPLTKRMLRLIDEAEEITGKKDERFTRQ